MLEHVWPTFEERRFYGRLQCNDYITFPSQKKQFELCSGSKENPKPCNITPSTIQSVGKCIHGLKPLLTSTRGLGASVTIRVPSDVSDYDAFRALDHAKYEELIRLGYILDPDDPFTTNSRAQSVAPGGETPGVTFGVDRLERETSSPSTIIDPRAEFGMIVRTHLLSCSFFLIYIYLGSRFTGELQPNYESTCLGGAHCRFV
jgi:hypothetical protein